VTKKDFPRDIAVRVLTRVLSDRQALDEAIAGLALEFPSVIKGGTRAWLQEVCSGALRWKGRLDLAIDAGAHHKKPSGWLRKILLISSYQLIAQDRTPAALVVSETVSEIRKKEGEAPARFANALLRKIAEHAVQWRELKLQSASSAEEAAKWASLPEWLWKALVKDHGREWTEQYALASLERPMIWIRSRQAFEWAEPGPVEGSFRILEGGPIFEKEGFVEGEFFVQDISSQFLVRKISEEVKTSLLQKSLGTEKVSALDFCAAPGGKSVGLLWSPLGEMPEARLEVCSSDRDEKRMALLRQTVERVGKGIRVVAPEQVDSLPEQDLVWVDAPCSGSGILRRHPEVRWLRKDSELDGLMKVQQELIRRAWAKVKSGGFFAYSVCSVLKDEGPGAIQKAGLQSDREWFLVPQVAPHGDGFWACLIRKP
jgi:16S rRNA (cytosine967-C5)-methyltransferase